MSVLYDSYIFSHFFGSSFIIAYQALSPKKSLPYFISFTLLIFSIFTSGFCLNSGTALSQLRETVRPCLVSLPCTLAWKCSPGCTGQP